MALPRILVSFALHCKALDQTLTSVSLNFCVCCFCHYFTCVCAADQEQLGEFEQERLELNSEMRKLKEQNERLTDDLSARSQTVDKLKNKVRLPSFCDKFWTRKAGLKALGLLLLSLLESVL